ncbi:cellulose binding domain-containing protein [Acrocarpospora catenulata]|uniref:cellulose binding domain-containing protein n=1 Tax=Acrocarpospora catenulata TaxID=2836182 RepID=UPI001BD9E33C|nr:cellulose binding domain-containing protein [Acrocarpospora catenulata]
MRTLRTRLVALAAAIPLTAALTFTAGPASAAPGCRVTYAIGSQWAGGFGADITITNLGDPLSSWQLRWNFAAGQTVVQGWNATYSQSGAAITATNVSYNGALATGASTGIGFNGSWTGSNPVPSSFTLNGTACTGSVVTSPTPTPSPGGRTWSSNADGFAATSGMGLTTTTGGAGGATVTVTTYADLVRYATAAQPYVIRVNGAITATPYGSEIRVASNKTIVGVGTGGHLVNGGFFLGSGVNNVIIRNLTIRDTRMPDDDPGDDLYDYDGIQMDGAHHVWIDHNHITRMNDGLIDSRLDTTYLTVSWNILSEDRKAFGIGWTSNVTSRMTIHHNWLRDNASRNPSTDNVAYAHLYNNYLQNITGYGNYARGATKMVLENSYFENVKDPYYRDDAAQLRQSGSICTGCTGQQETGGSAFTPSSFYSYTLDPASSVPGLLRTYAGPQANIGL